LGKEGLAPTYSQLGVYYINYPALAPEVKRVLARQIRDLVSDFNKEQRKWFFELYPQLLLAEGVGIFDVDAPAAALADYFIEYVYDVVDAVAAFAAAAQWLNIDGQGNFSSRISSRLKPTAMRTFATRIGTLPIPSALKNYVLSIFRVLRHDGTDDTISVFLPLMMPRGTKSPFEPTYVKAGEANVLEGSLGATYRHHVFPMPATSHHLVKTLAKADASEAAGEALIMGYTAAQITANSSLASNGAIANVLFRNVELAVQRIVDRYRASFMTPDSQMTRFFTSSLGLLDSTVTWDEITRTVVDNPIGNAGSFADEYMKYYELPGPVLSTTPYSGNPNASPYLDPDDKSVTPFSWQDSGWDVATIADVADAVANEYAGSHTLAEDTISKFTDHAFLITDDPDELEKLRHFAQTGSGGKVDITGEAGAATITNQFRDITFDWSKWNLFGYEESAIFGTSVIFPGASVTSPAYHPQSGAGSLLIATGVRSPDSPVDMDATVTNTPKYEFSHVGKSPVVAQFLKMLSSQMITFTGKPGTTAADMIGLAGDKGNWMMNIEEVERGILRPYRPVRPLVNNADPAQCGFYVVSSVEHIVDPTGKVQPNRWSQFFGTGLNGSDDTPNYFGTNPMQDQVLGAEDHLPCHDYIFFIGDALGLTPESHFARMDIAPYVVSARKASMGYKGVPYPIRPFVNRCLSSMRVPKGVVYHLGASVPTSSIGTPTVNYVDEVTGGCTAFSNMLSLMELAWKYWLPDLTFDEDHPFAETFFGYIEEAQKRMDSQFSGKDFMSIVSENLRVSSIASESIDEAIRRMLKISPSFERKELRPSFNPKDRKSQSRSMSPSSKFSKSPSKSRNFQKKTDIIREGKPDFEPKGFEPIDPKASTLAERDGKDEKFGSKLPKLD